jgi:hypothetical protein
MNRSSQFAADAAWLEQDWGIVAPHAQDWLSPELRRNFSMVMDAQPTLVTTPSAGIPFYFTQYIDPEAVRILQTPNKGAEIYGEEKTGDWTTQTALFNLIENTGEVRSYGDFNANGRSDVNASWESRQAYLFQTVIEYGDLEVDRAGEARLNLVAEKQRAAALTLDKFQDFAYHFGISGLANYGILNEPSLPSALTPTTKAATGVKWVNAGQVVAQASEVYADFQMLFNQLTANSFGYIDMNTRFKLVFPNSVASAFSAVNQFGITVREFISKTFPNVEYVTDPRYATVSGNVVQLIAESFNGAKTGRCAFNEKMRDHLVVRDLSSYKQKRTAGTFGFVLKYPLGVAQMLGV